MPDSADYLKAFLQEHTIRDAFIDHLNGLMDIHLEQPHFIDEIRQWLKRFQDAQDVFEKRQKELQNQQASQLERLSRAQSEWETLFPAMQERYEELRKQYIEVSERYAELLSDIGKLPETAASQGLWRQRLTFALAFLPRLPGAVTPDELSLIFGGIPVHLPNPYQPPDEAVVRIKRIQFEALPKAEQIQTRNIIELLISHHRLSPHPHYQTLRNNHINNLKKLIDILRRTIHARTVAE